MKAIGHWSIRAETDAAQQRLEAGIRAQRIECGYASVESIRERLADPPSDSAVRAMLAKLEAKGYVRHREEGLR